MGARLVLAGLLLLLTSCATQPAPPGTKTSAAGSPAGFESYAGAYRTQAGATYVVNGHGHTVRLGDGWIRQLFPASGPGRFSIGERYQVESPKEAEVLFRSAGGQADQMTIRPASGPDVVAGRLRFKETEVRVPAAGAELAATITESLTPGPHPGIVIVHGSGPGLRIDYGVWVGLYASLGLTVLAYDKRGNGASTGTYPGEYASEASLAVYAGDAAACLRFLAAWPGVDPQRVGFHGGSQGGWTVPLAIQRDRAPAAFAVLVSGPAVTVGQQGVWADFSGGSRSLPTASPAEMDAAVRAEHGGYDSGPVLAQIRTPIVWLNGETDRQVPTRVNTEVLQRLNKSNFNVQVLPGVSHGLLENPSGLVQDDLTATHLARDLFQRISAWLAPRAGTGPVAAA